MTTATITKSGERRFSAEWVLGTKENGDQIVAELSASHSKERKAFFATLNQVTVSRGENYSTRSFVLFSGASVGAERVARYSEKALREFFDRMLGYVEFERSLDGEIAAQFEIREEE